MRSSVSDRSSRSRLVGLVAFALAALTACRSSDPSGDGTSLDPRASSLGSSPEALSILSRLRERPASPLAAGVADGFQVGSAGLVARFSSAAGPTSRVTFPTLASAPVHVEDLSTGVAVDVTLQDARPVNAAAADGYLVYAHAHGSGATVLHRALPTGAEDFLAFETRPAAAEVSYALALGSGAHGLRLVEGTLEVLDQAGATRLRVSPPYLVGADGEETNASLAVAGCAVDTSAAPPWDHPVTAPGASTCTLHVSWPGAAVQYPAVLDPRWTTTGSMATARQEHTATPLSTGRVLVAGGRSGTGTTALSSAELYDRTTGTWAATGAMTGARRLATAVQLGTTASGTTSGKVLVAGGINGTTSLNTAQLYSATAGTWVAAGNLNAARHGHTATVLANGRVLVTGGLNGTTILASAALYNPASGAGSWAATTGPLPSAVRNHTASLLVTSNQQLSNKVLVVGGNNGTATQSGVFLFDPAQSAFSTLAALPGPREAHTVTSLPGGKLLVTGGKNGATTLATAVSFDPGFGPGSWSSAGTMTQARSGHTATLLASGILASGQVLIAGGSSGTAPLGSAELFSGTNTWAATTAMPAAVQGHTATLLGNGQVLIAGGLNGTTVQSAARLYDPSFGLPCSSAGQCATGFCANGVCCDTACTGSCGACNLPGKIGTCSPVAAGSVVCRAATGVCDVAESCNGTSLTCPADAFQPATTTCRAAAGVCDVAEHCTGTSAACPTDAFQPSTTTCRAAAGVCDVAETCTGTSAACPADAFQPSTTTCRAAAGVCDVAETCTGTSAACPADAFQPATTTCRAAAGVCDIAETCTGSSAACPADTFQLGTLCRFASDACDVAEVCLGNSPDCPPDAVQPSTTVCRGAAGACDVAELCDGTSKACPPDAFLDGRTLCRPAGGPCDITEACPGDSPDCPPDQLQPATTVCRPVAGACDVAEFCNGSSTQCPTDTFLDGRTICRLAGQECDQTEVCPGNSPDCPPDAKDPDGTSCFMPNATAACSNGTCTRITCDTGFDECNGATGDGCETPTTTAAVCAECGNACAVGNGNPFCQGGSCACSASDCATCNDQHPSIVTGSHVVTFSGYATSPGETISLSADIDQGNVNPAACLNLLDPLGFFTIGSTVSGSVPAFPGGVPLYPWTLTVNVPSVIQVLPIPAFTVWAPGGLARIAVLSGVAGPALTAAAFEDSACPGQHQGDDFPTLVNECASSSIVVAPCAAPLLNGYQVVTLVDPTNAVTDAPPKVSAAPFCPDQLGHYLYGIGEDLEPNLPTCDYATETGQYYDHIDPPDGNGQRTRDTLDKWKAANNYPGTDLEAVYYNSGDLGVGRNMHCWKTDPTNNPDAAACYVSNYGASFVDPPVSVDDALALVIQRDPTNIAATVAMEYIPTAGLPDPVRFFAFGSDGNRISAVKLDSENPKPVPGNCLTCHGGKYDKTDHIVGGPDPTGAQSRANFLPFDPCAFTFSTQHPYTLADQEETYRKLNQLVRETRPESRDGATITAFIDGMYGHDGGTVDTPGQRINEHFVPTAWQNAGLTKLYNDVVKPYCRTCHSSRSLLADPNDPTNNPSFTLVNFANNFSCQGQPIPPVEFRHFMPHAEATMKRFWTGSGRAALVNAFNDGSLASAIAGMSQPGIALTCAR